jgi:DNA polymerase-3 subunit beta
MQVVISREQLLRGTARAQSVVERRGTLPILANVLISAGDEQATLAATDLEVGIVSSHPAQVTEPGRTTLAARKLHEIVRELDSDEVELQTTADSRLRIRAGASEFSLLSVSADEYPSLPSSEGASFLPIEASLLTSLIDRTLYATSTDEARYHLNGVHVEIAEEHRLRVVATDGHRLALADAESGALVSIFARPLLVPRKAVSEIRRVCEDFEGTVELGLHENFLLLRRPGLLLTTRLIDAQFPNYRAVLPGSARIRVKLPRERLLQALRRIALVASDRAGGFQLRLAEGALQLSAVNPDLGEVREELPCEYSGPAFATSFDTRYIIDALASLISKEVLLEFVDELSPAQLRPADSADQIAVVMPMRL